MKIEITNRQAIRKLNLKHTCRAIRLIGRLLNLSSKKITFVFCDNRFIRKLNKKYFKKNIPTDVIAFNLAGEDDPDYLGEVIVSVEQALLAAGDLGLPWQEELLLYLVHGILHLVGYDDTNSLKRKQMQRKEQTILKYLK